jgi:hypothetical protein
LTYTKGSVTAPYPDRYLSPYFYEGSDAHIDSTIVSHAAYLAVEGGSFNGFSINGIGFDKVEQIWYRAETHYMLPDETFNQLYSHLIVTPFPKLEPGDMRESSRPVGPERIRDEEATQCRTGRSVAANSGRGVG